MRGFTWGSCFSGVVFSTSFNPEHCSFIKSLHSSTGLRCMEQECFSAEGIALCTALCSVVGDFTFFIKQVVIQCFLIILGIIYCFFQLVPSVSVQGSIPETHPLPCCIPDIRQLEQTRKAFHEAPDVFSTPLRLV